MTAEQHTSFVMERLSAFLSKEILGHRPDRYACTAQYLALILELIDARISEKESQ